MTCILLSLSILVWGAFGAGIAYQRIARGVPLPYLIDQMQPVSLALSMAVAVLWTVFVTTVICALLGGIAAAIAYREQAECPGGRAID